jgi:hypothetical protein
MRSPVGKHRTTIKRYHRKMGFDMDWMEVAENVMLNGRVALTW